MERFYKEDDRDFRTVKELRDILDDWLTSPGAFADLGVGYVESGNGECFTRVLLMRERLSDGSRVFGIRLAQ